MVIIILFTAYTIHRIAFFNRLTCWLLVMLVFYKTERSREFPRGRGGGYFRFQVTGMIEWGQKSKPKKTPGPEFNPKNIPCRISEP